MSTNGQVKVRFAVVGDAAAIASIINHYIERGTANFRTEPQADAEWVHEIESYGARYPWLVAEVEGTVAGVAYAKPWNPRQAYDWTAESTIYIADGQQGMGVGSALYTELLKRLEALGFRSVMAGVTSGNPGSEALHSAFGYQRVGTIRAAGYKFGAWHDVTLWQKELRIPADPPAPTAPVDR